MSKHTPGPWRIGTPPPNGEQTIGTLNGLMVAVATTGQDIPTKSNARLIAAAPELLEALEGVIRVADRATIEFDAARAAITKAKGEQTK